MNKHKTYHAIKINHNICYDYTHCMHVCPTNSIRITNGKVHIMIDKCIDCGVSFKNGIANAIYVEHDDFNTITKYKYRVALVPAVLTGQFQTEISEEEIFEEMYKLGFTHVYHAKDMAVIIKYLINKQIKTNTDRPLISTFCPAILRLIQVKFPSLLSHLVKTLPPIDASAIYYRKLLMQKGIPENEIGIFYITPCAAKTASIKNNLSSSNYNINGAIKNSNSCTTQIPLQSKPNQDNITWSLSRGELSHNKRTGLAVDEINNVIEFLESLENRNIPDVYFIELKTCDKGYAGGALLQENRFLTVEKIRTRAKRLDKTPTIDSVWDKYKDVLKYTSCFDFEVKDAPSETLDEYFTSALKKTKRIRDLMYYLPGINCGACGSPTCQTLAENVVQKHYNLSACVFLQRNMEKNKLNNNNHVIRIIEKT